MEQPLVTIITVSYNHSKYVRENLDSIKAQTYPNIQLIICDDKSGDNSTEVINQWLQENNYTAQKIFHDINTGLSAILNEALELVEGKYLKYIAADDFLEKDAIARCVAKLELLGEDYAIYYGDIHVVDEFSNHMEDVNQIKFPKDYKPLNGNCFRECIPKFPFWAQAALFRVEQIKKTHFKFNKRFFSEDWYIILHLSRYAKIAGETTPFVYYRVLQSSVTRQNWNVEKLPLVYFSWFEMIYSFLKHPKNTDDDTSIIEEKLFSLLMEIYPYNRKLKIKLMTKYFLLVWRGNKRFGLLKKIPRLYQKLRYL